MTINPLTTLPMLPDTDQDAVIMRAFHAAGHRITAPRLALLNILREQGGFLNVDTLYQIAAARGENLSLATVYRTLLLFKQMNLVEGRLVGDDQSREEYRFRSVRDFYTLTCKRCGAIVPVEPDIVEAFRQEVTETLGVTVLTAHSCFIGYCAACTAAMAAEE
ncbi:MAG: transcriptional repressor [Chloroflexi bacterium]|nr:transcriptional repressor [Chloroflexota bacterium]